MRTFLVLALLLATAIAGARSEDAAQPRLVIEGSGSQRQLTAAALLARSDAAIVSIPDDVSYRRAMSYRAVPLLNLLGGISDNRFDTLEARATDGFVSQIPLSLIASGASGGAVPWIAVEIPAQPWPKLPNATASAGPFYLVWEHPGRSGVRSEQWPYALSSLAFVESPAHRWPQLNLPDDLKGHDAARRGQEVFLVQCLPCHRLKGGGPSDTGPDLGLPLNATQYLSDRGLRAIIRDPRSVRTWPMQAMQGFDESALPDVDLDAVVAYLHAMAGTRETAN